MTSQARAIVWAQWRSVFNYYPRSNKAGIVFTVLASGIWYGMWLVFAVLLARIFREPANAGLTATVLPSGLLFVFLYWQIVPVLLASTGVSLSSRKLLVYPIETSQLFLIELLLRATTTGEMFLVLAGTAIGLVANPDLPVRSPAGIAIFAAFNLCLSAGTRELLVRIFERKRIREIAVLLLVMLGAIPQLVMAFGLSSRFSTLLQAGTGVPFLPWTAAAALAGPRTPAIALPALLVWTGFAYAFGRWQYSRTLRFDAAESNATERPDSRTNRRGLAEVLAGWPRLLFRDPLGALVEKEILFLARAPRFRLVFIMGFTFGLVLWLPMALGNSRGTIGANFLAFTSLYALLLLGDVCFWNVFGFDRLAAQVYWAMPVRLSTVLVGKNITALFFVLLEVTMIALVCGLFRMPVTSIRVAEAYSVALVASIYVMSLGNLTSTASARPINASKAMRSGSPGKLQALMLLLYPVAAGPVLLAYGARYAFNSEWAFFGVLAICTAVGAAVYWVSLESALAAAERNKEKLLAALAAGEGVMQG